MSTQTQGVRTTNIRGYRRRKSMLDLNMPPNETRDEAGTSTQAVPLEVQPRQQRQLIPPTAIDVEAIDDDVVESSPTAFAEAKNNAQRRTRGRTVVFDVESGGTARFIPSNHNKRRRVSSSRTIINCDLYINLESSGSSMRENVHVPPAPPPPPPKEPTFSCPICMGPLVEETSTKCGHIFCKACIKTAIATQAKCPTCRKKLNVKELIRVFLPAASMSN